jgi:methylenetetrahydrofolate dehydrogenase (NADP+)/methenyltetrahydrofolate cyclohydrolase
LPAEIIDGIAIAAKVRARVADEAAALKAATGIVPGLTAVLVGNDPASSVYVASKEKACKEAGMRGESIRLPASTSETELLAVIDRLNADPAVHGILVQMPLPKQISEAKVIRHIDPHKDVDGFHPMNVGKLFTGDLDSFAPCTPAGVQVMLAEVGIETAGKDAVIIGRSNIVGKPMAALLLQAGKNADCTVTLCHSRTKDLGSHTRRADILIAAVGRPEMVTGDMVKPGAVVIDVGINRIDDPTSAKGYRIVGDVHFDQVSQVASRISPVPGGVGRMTIAMLLSNTVRAARLSAAS